MNFQRMWDTLWACIISDEIHNPYSDSIDVSVLKGIIKAIEEIERRIEKVTNANEIKPEHKEGKPFKEIVRKEILEGKPNTYMPTPSGETALTDHLRDNY